MTEPTEEECVYLLSLVVRLCTVRGIPYLDALRFVQAMPYPQLAEKFIDLGEIPGILAELRGRLDTITPPDATEVVRLRDDNARLRVAIRNHRDQRGDDRCFLDDEELYRALGESGVVDLSLPSKCEFLKSCERFWEQRQSPQEKDGSPLSGLPRMTIRQLEDTIARLRTLLDDLEWSGDSVNEECPCCRNHSFEGHAADCYLKAALEGR